MRSMDTQEERGRGGFIQAVRGEVTFVHRFCVQKRSSAKKKKRNSFKNNIIRSVALSSALPRLPVKKVRSAN